MISSLFEQLQEQDFISTESLDNIRKHEANKTVSVTGELRTLLYLGVLLLSTGLGIVIYKNLDSISHLAIVAFIALATAGCFAICLKKAPSFSRQKSGSPGMAYDYLLLLGSLLLLILVTYLQYQYKLFGNRLGLATFIPMVMLFAAAYYFDHLGVLSLAIINLAAWAGITITPLRFLKDNDFSSSRIILAGFALGFVLIALGAISNSKKIKKHFRFTYKNFGTHFLFISAIAAIVHFQTTQLLWVIPLAFITAYQFKEAVKELSFYFLVMSTLYFYVGFSYLLVHNLYQLAPTEASLYLALLYFIVTAVLIAQFFMKYNKQFK